MRYDRSACAFPFLSLFFCPPVLPSPTSLVRAPVHQKADSLLVVFALYSSPSFSGLKLVQRGVNVTRMNLFSGDRRLSFHGPHVLPFLQSAVYLRSPGFLVSRHVAERESMRREYASCNMCMRAIMKLAKHAIQVERLAAMMLQTRLMRRRHLYSLERIFTVGLS